MTKEEGELGALSAAYFSLVRVLHRRGAITLAELANDLGDTIDRRRKRGLALPALTTLYEQVLKMEQLEAKRSALLAARDSPPPAQDTHAPKP